MSALALIYLLVCFGSAGVIGAAIAGGRRPKMGVMWLVWPITALYGGPVALWAFFRFGTADRKPDAVAVSIGVSHCGAGCTLGDILGEYIVFFTGWELAGSVYPAAALVTFGLAWSFGVVLQYFAIVPMRHLPVGKGIVAAIKADTLSILAFQAGMLAWMALVQYVFYSRPLTPGQWLFWFQMQIAMVIGFVTAYPMNAWLIAKGWKEKM